MSSVDEIASSIEEPEDSGVVGYLNLHVRNGEITNAFSHIDVEDLPENCVIHMKIGSVLSYEEFVEAHGRDKDELKALKGLRLFILDDEPYVHEQY